MNLRMNLRGLLSGKRLRRTATTSDKDDNSNNVINSKNNADTAALGGDALGAAPPSISPPPSSYSSFQHCHHHAQRSHHRLQNDHLTSAPTPPQSNLSDYPVLILLGLNVAKAFGVENPTLLSTVTLATTATGVCFSSTANSGTSSSPSPPQPTSTLPFGTRFSGSTSNVVGGRQHLRCLVFPHPSGVSHYWNTDANCRKAAFELRKALGAQSSTQLKYGFSVH